MRDLWGRVRSFWDFQLIQNVKDARLRIFFDRYWPPNVESRAFVGSGDKLKRPRLHPAILGIAGTNCLMSNFVPAKLPALKFSSAIWSKTVEYIMNSLRNGRKNLGWLGPLFVRVTSLTYRRAYSWARVNRCRMYAPWGMGPSFSMNGGTEEKVNRCYLVLSLRISLGMIGELCIIKSS